MTMLPPLDSDVAAAVARALAKPGPRLGSAERADVVASLHSAAARAHGIAVDVSGLPDPGTSIPVRVLGRVGWAEANLRSARVMTAHVTDPRPREEWSLAEKVRARAIGAQAGAVLAWLASHVIGQYDPFAATPTLYFCAPNVLQIEREIGADPDDFRLWLAVHELTHRLQFARAPWLVDRLQTLLADILDADDADGFTLRPSSSLVEATTGPQRRRVLDEVAAVMSVVEGHAQMVMEDVPATDVATIATIRDAFAQRRRRRGLDAGLRRALGMDAKIAQYRDGAAFCRAVVAEGGRGRLNLVWESAETFPTPTELRDPAAWLRRVG